MTILKSVCMDCKRAMGEKDGQGESGTSHSVCPTCWPKRMPGKEYPVAPSVTYRGWPGHYISALRCVFRLNTLVDLANVRVVVSTVGNQRTKDGVLDDIRNGCCYETMAFHAVLEATHYWDADVCRSVDITGRCRVERLTQTSDREAQAMHEAAVADIASRIRKGEISNAAD